MSARVHHSAIVVRDVEASLRFWRDGIGFVQIMDEQFDGDWPTLFGAPSSRLRSIFLGDPDRSDSGIVELVQFVPAPDTEPAGPVGSSVGFFLLSCYVDVDAVLERLAALGLGGEPRRITVGPDGTVQMATVIDPDGVLVELIGIPGLVNAVDGIVFDFDGLILDTERPVFVAWQEAFLAHGCTPLTLDEWAHEIGTAGGLDLVEMIRTRATVPFDEHAMDAQRRKRRDELLALETIRPGVEAWLDEADTLGIPLAVASSSARDWVETHLGRLGLLHRFAFLACFGDEGPDGTALGGKPGPDTYLAACSTIGVEPSSALAIEDSPHGVAAAKAAGLWCLAVPHEITERLDLSHADVRVQSLADVTIGEVSDLLVAH